MRYSTLALRAAACCFLWGSMVPGVKIGYRVLRIASDDVASQIIFAGIVFMIAGIIGLTGRMFLQRRNRTQRTCERNRNRGLEQLIRTDAGEAERRKTGMQGNAVRDRSCSPAGAGEAGCRKNGHEPEHAAGKRAACIILTVGLLQTAGQYLFLYIGLAHTSGVRGSILTSTNVFVSIFISTVLLRLESRSIRKI